MPEKFTASEIKANLKFLFLIALIISISTFSLQLMLMHYEKQTNKLYHDLSQTELEISQYRNLVWLIHNNDSTNNQEDYLLNEYKQIEETLENSQIEFMRSHFLSIQKKIRSDRLIDYSDLIDHDECLSIMAQCSTYATEYRNSHNETLEAFQKRVDLINMLILALLTVLSFFFVYTMFYANYGE
jgi:hypothetical protein